MNCNNMYNVILNINEEYLTEAQSTDVIRRSIKNEKRKKAVTAGSVAVCASIVFFACKMSNDTKTKTNLTGESTTQIYEEGGLNGTASDNSADETTVKNDNVKTTETYSQKPENDGGETGGSISSVISSLYIPVPPCMCNAQDGINVTGAEITDPEAQQYFKDNYALLKSSLSASGVSVDDFTISEKGYCHISYDGTEGKMLELRQNYRDYLVYNGKELVAIITLVKDDNGKLWDSPAFGASWFKAFNDFLQNNRGQELIFIYAKNTELVLGTQSMMNPQGYADPTRYLDSIDDVYNYFYHEKAVYIP